jgi:hypothetical protein
VAGSLVVGISQGSRGYFENEMGETTRTGIPPSAEASDHEDVLVLLKAATALWEDDDTNGALRWFARAAQAASDVGDDRRALQLARAVADLRDRLAGPAVGTVSPPKSVTMPPPPSARKPSLPPKPPSMRLRSVSAAPRPMPVASSRPPPSAPKAVDAAAPTGASLTGPKGEQDALSVRVSVKTSVRDPDLLIVRVLRKGQAAPSGWGEAVLAPMGRGFDLASLRR